MRSLAGLGHPSLLAALGFALAGTGLSAAGAATRRVELAVAGRRALGVTAGFVVVATAALLSALFAHDFSLQYVADYSSRSLAGAYTLSALWGGMEGSLLFWTLLLTVFSALAFRRSAVSSDVAVDAWAAAILGGVAVFFLTLLALPADPFTPTPQVPADGRGLNPLLQSPGMLIHPPLLYTGFVGFSVPFAFAMGGLLAGRTDRAWFTRTRRWSLFAWSALSIGIVLGGAWAYTELGWGGYWAWDPVENASFMPWLTATAYLHSVVIQEKRRMFKAWNVTLILLTYVLAVFGTFLTRSGILSSIHTFTEGPIGKWFLPFLAAMLLGGIAVIAARSALLRGENRFDSLLSRESVFLFNNVLLVAAAFTILWGTIYPIVAEVFSGTRLSVGPPFFNSVFVPVGLALVALAGIGPLVSWRRMSKPALAAVLRLPTLAALVTIAALAIAGVRSIGALAAFGICAFTAVAIAEEFRRGSRIHRARESLGWTAALFRTLLRNRRRYGGYLVHLGVVLIVLGLAGAGFRTEKQAMLDEGDSLRLGDYTLTYDGVSHSNTAEKQINEAAVVVTRGDERVGVLRPQRNLHLAQQQWQSEVAIRTTPLEDVYVVVTAFDPDGAAAVRAFVNPLTWWIWMGAAVMAAGMAVILSGGVTVAAPAAARRVAEPAVATR